jgi:hypothetical protein
MVPASIFRSSFRPFVAVSVLESALDPSLGVQVYGQAGLSAGDRALRDADLAVAQRSQHGAD